MTTENAWMGKVAIVTGGSSGIGKATTLALVAQGAKVVITGRDQVKLDAVANEHDAIIAVLADSADPESAERIVGEAVNKWGRIDFVMNNAGAGALLPVDAYDFKAIADLCAVNIVAPSLLVKAALPALRESKGTIVNIATAISRNAAPMLAHYSATKAALEHLTQAWAVELARDGIRVNAIAPGPVKSGALTGLMGLSQEMAKMIEENETAQVPLGRRGVADDIVPWVLQLASPANEWTSGQIITVDGAWSLRSQS
jgi:NAD(P)-dependent dehydrogenase (short-subunit alcohol dehydrogenase family)